MDDQGIFISIIVRYNTYDLKSHPCVKPECHEIAPSHLCIQPFPMKGLDGF